MKHYDEHRNFKISKQHQDTSHINILIPLNPACGPKRRLGNMKSVLISHLIQFDAVTQRHKQELRPSSYALHLSNSARTLLYFTDFVS